MTDLILEAYDRFVVLYDLVALINDDVTEESALGSAVHLSPDIVGQMLSFMLSQGFVKTARGDSEFKITALGSSFLQQFQGMRRFLS
jgi:predicted transcriptional regulator